MARERWWADDWEITQGTVRDVETREGLLRTAGKRGGNVTIPAQHGEVWRPKKLGPGGFVLNLWLGNNTREEAEGYYDDLLRATAGPTRRMVRFTRLTAKGEYRVAYGEVVSSVEPTAIGQTAMRCGIEVGIPSGRWLGQESLSAFTAVGATSGTRLALTPHAGSTAPLDNLTYRVEGPITNPTVRDVTAGQSGESWTWTGVVAAGQSLTVENSTWAVTGGGGLSVPHTGPLSYTGDRYLTVEPAPPGQAPTVELTGANTGAGTRLVVTGPASYLA